MCPSLTLQTTSRQSWRTAHWVPSTYTAFNTFLNNAHDPGNFQEELLAHWFQQLEDAPSFSHFAHWLSLARLTEAALLTAGARADRADFQGATDLLANPRRINVHFMGSSRQVRKQRHMPLSQQFAHPESTPLETLHHLAQKTMLHIAEEAILPALSKRLQAAAEPKNQTYLRILEHRMERIAEVLNFLASDGVFCPPDLQSRLNHLSGPKRKWYASQLCNFRPDWFWKLGQAFSLCLQSALPACPCPDASDQNAQECIKMTQKPKY